MAKSFFASALILLSGASHFVVVQWHFEVQVGQWQDLVIIDHVILFFNFQASFYWPTNAHVVHYRNGFGKGRVGDAGGESVQQLAIACSLQYCHSSDRPHGKERERERKEQWIEPVRSVDAQSLLLLLSSPSAYLQQIDTATAAAAASFGCHRTPSFASGLTLPASTALGTGHVKLFDRTMSVEGSLTHH